MNNNNKIEDFEMVEEVEDFKAVTILIRNKLKRNGKKKIVHKTPQGVKEISKKWIENKKNLNIK